MSILDRAELLLQAKNYSGSGDWLDESGNGHDAQLGSTSGADTNDPLFKPWNGTDYLYLPGSASNYASTADVNLLDADTAHLYQSKANWSARAQASAVTKVARSDSEYGFVGQFSAQSPSGNCSVRATASSTSTDIAVSPTTQYSMTMRISTTAGATRQARLVIDWITAVPAFSSTSAGSYVTVPADGSFVEITVTGTSDGSAAYAVPYVQISDASDGDVFQFEQVCLRTGPDATFVPSLRIVGDLDIEAKLAASDWTPSATKYIVGNESGLTGFTLAVNPSGNLYSTHLDGSATPLKAVAILGSLTDGEAHVVRGTWDISTGIYTGYIDGTPTAAATVGAFTPTPSGGALQVGQRLDGSFSHNADIYYVEVRDGIDGPIVAEYRASDATEPFATHTGSVDGRTWTHNRSASGLVSTVVDRDMFLLTTDDYFEIADDAGLNFAADESFTLMAVLRVTDTATTRVIAGHRVSRAPSAIGYDMHFFSDEAVQFEISDGTNEPGVLTSAVTPLELTAITGVRDVTADDLEAFLDGVGTGSPTTDSTTGTLTGVMTFRIGANSAASPSSEFFEGQIIAVALFREALTDNEIEQVGLYLIHGIPDNDTSNLLVLGLL